jgi:outer membrane protein assembly factor BamB
MLDLQSAGANPITVKWCASLDGGGSPIITTTDGSSNPVVWVLGAGGDNKLHAFNAMTGASIYNSAAALNGLHNFQTLIAANSKLYIAADNTVYAFTFTP